MERRIVQFVVFDNGLTPDQKRVIQKCHGYNEGVNTCQDNPNCQINMADMVKKCPFKNDCTVKLSYSPRGILTITGYCVKRKIT